MFLKKAWWNTLLPQLTLSCYSLERHQAEVCGQMFLNLIAMKIMFLVMPQQQHHRHRKCWITTAVSVKTVVLNMKASLSLEGVLLLLRLLGLWAWVCQAWRIARTMVHDQPTIAKVIVAVQTFRGHSSRPFLQSGLQKSRKQGQILKHKLKLLLLTIFLTTESLLCALCWLGTLVWIAILELLLLLQSLLGLFLTFILYLPL